MAMPTRSDILFDQTSAANTVLVTGPLDVRMYDQLLVEYMPIGGPVAVAAGMAFRDVDTFGTTVTLWSILCPADAFAHTIGFGVAVGGAATGVNVTYLGGLPGPLPNTVQIFMPSFGVGIQCRLVVRGRRNHRGPDVSINAD